MSCPTTRTYYRIILLALIEAVQFEVIRTRLFSRIFATTRRSPFLLEWTPHMYVFVHRQTIRIHVIVTCAFLKQMPNHTVTPIHFFALSPNLSAISSSITLSSTAPIAWKSCLFASAITSSTLWL